MAHSTSISGQYDRRALDTVESALLSSRVGETFDATVIAVTRSGGSIQLIDPAVTAHCDGALVAGSVVRAKLVAADIASGTSTFTLA